MDRKYTCNKFHTVCLPWSAISLSFFLGSWNMWHMAHVARIRGRARQNFVQCPPLYSVQQKTQLLPKLRAPILLSLMVMIVCKEHGKEDYLLFSWSSRKQVNASCIGGRLEGGWSRPRMKLTPNLLPLVIFFNLLLMKPTTDQEKPCFKGCSIHPCFFFFRVTGLKTSP